MSLKHTDYAYTTEANPHARRSREIIKKYPQVKDLMGPYPLSALYITLIVLQQFLLAIVFAKYDISWWWILLTSYLVGAIANHAMFVMIHDACHDVIWKTRFWNKVWGIICNLPQAFPSAISFRTYHLLHHSHLNEYDYDADLAFHKEAKWIGNSTIRKALWFVGFMIIEAVRPARLKKGKVFDTWAVINIVVVVASDILLWNAFGFKALGYLLLSSFWSVGLHPVGARWIQEHYTYKEGQETFSYYGILNKLSFNIGYHNEHHDLFRIPWVYLPKLKAMAPEYYENLHFHTSWTKLILDFIFNPERDLYCRIVRKNHRLANYEAAESEQESLDIRLSGEEIPAEGI